MDLVGGSDTPAIEALEPLSSRSNYLLGNDPHGWITGVPHFRRVRYSGVYPGIDIVVYGRETLFEYDFVVAPGGDPGVIHLAFHDPEDIYIDQGGSLVLSTRHGQMVQRRPEAYQELGTSRTYVESGFVVLDDQTVTFELGEFDPSLPLIIDPVLGSVVYSTFFGSNGEDLGRGIAVGEDGSAYLVGSTDSASFPTHAAWAGSISGPSDAFVAKLAPGGRSIVYATYIGGSGDEVGLGVAVDSAGSPYLVGETTSTDFPTWKALQKTYGGGSNDAFVVKLKPPGSSAWYSTYLGGTGLDSGRSVAVDALNQPHIVGTTMSTNFPTQAAWAGTINGSHDAFITRLGWQGTPLLFSTYFGGSSLEEGDHIALDSFGNMFIAGRTNSAMSFPTWNAFQPSYGGGTRDGYVARLYSTGSILFYATFLGGADFEYVGGLATDSTGSAFVFGSTYSPDFSTTAAYQPTFGGGASDAYAARFTPGGGAIFSTFFGGSGADYGDGLVLDRRATVYVAGGTDSTNFPTVEPIIGQHQGGTDAFVARFGLSGRTLLFSTYFGGAHTDTLRSLGIDPWGATYAAGDTRSWDFPTFSALQTTHAAGGTDTFIAKILPPLDFFIAGADPGVTSPQALPVSKAADPAR
jgi:hypothetical protein